jgi:hypothetical protein
MQLRSFEEIGLGAETPVLPAGSAVIDGAYFTFPKSSADLTPVAPRRRNATYPRFSVFTFPEVVLHGAELYEAASGFFTDHSLVDPASAVPFFNGRLLGGYVEGVKYDPANDAIVETPAKQTVDCDGCFIVDSYESAAFGSWLFRIMPKILLLLPKLPVRRVMLFDGAPWIADMIKLIEPQPKIVSRAFRRTFRLLNPSVPSLASPDAYHRPEIQAALEPIIERACRAFPNTPEKIYVSRRKVAIRRPTRRVLENETELVEHLLARGFVEFIPEDRPLLEQFAHIAQARIIVSPGGSNLYGCYFARKADFIIDLEASNVFLDHHFSALASCGRPFTMICGKQNERATHPHHHNWTIDIPTLLAGLDSIA